MAEEKKQSTKQFAINITHIYFLALISTLKRNKSTVTTIIISPKCMLFTYFHNGGKEKASGGSWAVSLKSCQIKILFQRER